MEDNLESPSLVKDGPTPSPGSSAPRRPSQQPLSCTHCRQRKIKCDKIHPCTPCQKSSLNCIFLERVRHPKKRQNESKVANDELLRRVARMEELIGKMKDEGKDVNGLKTDKYGSASPESMQTKRELSEGAKSSNSNGSDVNRFIGSAYWRSLTNDKHVAQKGSDQEKGASEGATTDEVQDGVIGGRP